MPSIMEASAQQLADNREEPTYIAFRWYVEEGDQKIILFEPEILSTDCVLKGFLPRRRT